MSWKPRATLEIAQRRAALLAAVREYFAANDVLEVDTPALGSYTVTEPNIDSLSVGSSYLQTSPEYFMKRMLAAGYPDIYQICKVFRDSESGSKHLSEFTMLEWYRHGFGLHEIMRDTAACIACALGKAHLADDVVLLRYADAVRYETGLDVFDARTEQLADVADADSALRASIGDRRDAWLDLVFATKISPGFATDRLTAVYHYPLSQAALARRSRDDSRCADRFEFYFGQLEVANGFVELTDADEQLARFRRDQESRRLEGKAHTEIDANLIAALRAGLPQCAGVAVGLDRIMMVLTGQDDIATISSFPNGK